MKTLKQILFTFAAVAGLSLAVSAQKNDPKPRPPKDKPPVVKPGDKKPPRDNKGDRPKKPGMSMFVAAARTDDRFA